MSRERVAAALTAAALGDPAAGAKPARAELVAQLASAHEELAGHGCTRAGCPTLRTVARFNSVCAKDSSELG